MRENKKGVWKQRKRASPKKNHGCCPSYLTLVPYWNPAAIWCGATSRTFFGHIRSVLKIVFTTYFLLLPGKYTGGIRRNIFQIPSMVPSMLSLAFFMGIVSLLTWVNPPERISNSLVASSWSSCPNISTSSSVSWNYDVFLSFRGVDTRKTYVNHLYNELELRLIHTFKDDKTIPHGDFIGSSLKKAIEESRIGIIIFSKDYAGSKWCLDELTYIMSCTKERGLIAIPLFYDVDPSEVKEQKGEVRKAFSKIAKTNKKAETWRKALAEASTLVGWVPKNIANGQESDGIKQIVDEISDILYSLNSNIDKGLVGMKSRSHSLKSQLKIGSGGVRMVGISGIGGGGKSTLAFSVYKEISPHFKGHFFVDNIREKSINNDGLKNLQENILSSFLRKQVRVQSIEDGKQKIKQMLRRSNVIMVLDDVDHHDQLEALAGSHDWFGDGSRIIITARDEHILKTHKVDDVSVVSLLSNDEATELFRKFAYREDEPVEDYEELSQLVISYAGGLPLALKVLGKFLYNKDKNEWNSALARLKSIPEMEIIGKLKISYDGLKSVEKELFLDIACFFRGWTVTDAMEILDACGLHSRIGIKVLEQKALITTLGDRFDMHDLVQVMGFYIIQGEYPNIPYKHTRVWQTNVLDDMCFRDETKQGDDYIKVAINDNDSLRCPELVLRMKKLFRGL